MTSSCFHEYCTISSFIALGDSDNYPLVYQMRQCHTEGILKVEKVKI